MKGFYVMSLLPSIPYNPLSSSNSWSSEMILSLHSLKKWGYVLNTLTFHSDKSPSHLWKYQDLHPSSSSDSERTLCLSNINASPGLSLAPIFSRPQRSFSPPPLSSFPPLNPFPQNILQLSYRKKKYTSLLISCLSLANTIFSLLLLQLGVVCMRCPQFICFPNCCKV